MMIGPYLFRQVLICLGIWLCYSLKAHGAVADAHDQPDAAKSIDLVESSEDLHRLTNPTNHCVDIVAVHGLDGHWRRSWTAANGVFWLQDLLAPEIPCARVYSFSHDSRTRGSDTPLTLDIADHGRALIAELSMERRITKTDKVPIIFIGHSLGGIIVKSALLESDLARIGHLERYKSIKLSTYAVLFLGTPHQGGEGVSMVEIIRKVSSTVSHTNKKLLDKMVRNSDWLLELQSRYNSISQDFETICFYETQKMPLPIGKLLIVPKDSAVLFGAANSEAVPLLADHSTIAKFESSNDHSFQKIVKRLKLLANDATTRIRENWMHWESQGGGTQNPIQKHRLDPDEKEFNLGIAFNSMRNPHFTGRQEILQSLHGKLQLASNEEPLGLVVLYGAGGMGKTQIAIEYAHRFKTEYTSIFWIDGSRNYTAAADMLKALEELKRHYEVNGLREKPWFGHIEESLAKNNLKGDEEESPFASSKRASDHALRDMFLRWLSSAGNCGWLMVIDNVDDLESFDFRSWLPSTLCGSVVMTSRRRDLARHWQSIEVDTMTHQEAIRLLAESSGVALGHGTQEWDSSVQLIDELGHLPLAISQAGAHIFMSREPSPVSRYLARYQKFPKELLASNGAQAPWDSKKETVLTTWEISFAAIRKRDPLAARILLLCGFLDRNAIMEPLFRGQGDTELEVNQAFGLLVSYSFLRVSTFLDISVYSIHPLIHRWISDRMENGEKEATAKQVANRLRKYEGETRYNHISQLLSIFQSLYPCQTHPASVISVPERSGDAELPETSQHFQVLSSAEGWILRFRGWAHEFTSVLRRKYLRDDDSTLSYWELLYSLCPSTHELWRDLIEWVICHALRELPPKHPRMLEMIGNYAHSYISDSAEDLHTARSWYWWLVLARTQVLGPCHPATAGAYLGLGRTFYPCQKSLALLGTACDVRIKSLGYGDSLTQNALQHFASEVDRCRGPALNMDHVFARFFGLLKAQGESRALEIFDQRFYALYLLRTAEMENTRLSTPDTWRQLRPFLQAFFDMLPILNYEQKLRLGQEFLSATDSQAQPPFSSTKENQAYLNSQPYIVGLDVLTTDPVSRPSIGGMDKLLYPSKGFKRYLLHHRSSNSWPTDGRNWRLLLPLARCPGPDLSLARDKFENDPPDQGLVFEWFDSLDPMLVEAKVYWGRHSRKWIFNVCVYLGAPEYLTMPGFRPAELTCIAGGYLCEKADCMELTVLLVLTGYLKSEAIRGEML